MVLTVAGNAIARFLCSIASTEVEWEIEKAAHISAGACVLEDSLGTMARCGEVQKKNDTQYNIGIPPPVFWNRENIKAFGDSFHELSVEEQERWKRQWRVAWNVTAINSYFMTTAAKMSSRRLRTPYFPAKWSTIECFINDGPSDDSDSECEYKWCEGELDEHVGDEEMHEEKDDREPPTEWSDGELAEAESCIDTLAKLCVDHDDGGLNALIRHFNQLPDRD